MFKPFITVVVPSYNAEKYIEETLQSVWDQTYDGVIEIVVADDCSTDGSIDVIKAFEASHSGNEKRPFRLIISDKNQGVAQTRNTGVKEAAGEYICYLDSDDFWDVTKIEKQINALAAFKEDERPVLICTARELVGRGSQSLGKVIHVPSVITYDMMLKTNLIPCSSVMVRKDAALQFPMERDDLVEDYINWMKIIEAFGPAAGIDEPLMKYRVIQGSRSRNKLKAAGKHFKAQRYIGVPFSSACLNFVSYVIKGVGKI